VGLAWWLDGAAPGTRPESKTLARKGLLSGPQW